VRGQGLTAIASFNFTNGAYPETGVTFDANGNLFGTTGLGGTEASGTVWEIAHGSSTVTTLAPIPGGVSLPGGMTFDANGNLYGAAAYPDGYGWVLELAKGSSAITTLASFNGTNGNNPWGNVAFDKNGNLYGATVGGGVLGISDPNGTVWEITKGSGTITTLSSFNGANGASPYGGVTIDANGNLFGTTTYGGTNNSGTVWEIAKGSGTITALASFNWTNGGYPSAGVTVDSNGDLFGTAEYGGTKGSGTVWELAKGSGTITALDSFNSATNGAFPLGRVTLDASGNLFGTAEYGGANNDGTVWELAQGSGTIVALDSFNGTNGAGPYAGVTFDANGNLFGTAREGGANNDGTVWEIQTASVPEPSSIVMGLIGMALAGGFVVANRASARPS
jgi:uncharacterized repeat protein (TIGR03803 family)